MTNSDNLSTALAYLRSVIVGRLRVHAQTAQEADVGGTAYHEDDSTFSAFVKKHAPSFDEYILLLLALAPHIHPHFFDRIIAEHFPEGGDLPEFGGTRGQNHRGMLPTGETAQFVLAGNDLKKRLDIQLVLSNDPCFVWKRMLWLDAVREGEPLMSGRLMLDPDIVEQLTTGIISRPKFSVDFPAEYIETEMDWEDLVLHPGTMRQIHEIDHWITHNDTVRHEWGLKKKLKPGYRALFYGPPGTGKTLTVTLLGKHTGNDVFRIDLSRVVSKYIGETEKNLSRLFDKAEHKNWILFFDEADALFGKRTDIRDAHDKYANQEVAYLLQRIEGYNGLVILATNQRTNIDDAFVRRFQAIIHFPIPRPEERYAIWQRTFPAQMVIANDIDWHQVATRYELTGAGILNVAHYCAIEVLANQSAHLDRDRLESAIMREYAKEGKIL